MAQRKGGAIYICIGDQQERHLMVCSKPPAMRLVVDALYAAPHQSMESTLEKPKLPLILADSTLGRLVKWLRLAGIDTRLDPSAPDPERLLIISRVERRWIVTRTLSVFEKSGPDKCLLLNANAPIDQIRCVMDHFRIERQALRPLTRCVRCNQVMTSVLKEEIIGRIPEYVWQRHEEFKTCSECRRIYWHGTHARRIDAMMNQWFR